MAHRDLDRARSQLESWPCARLCHAASPVHELPELARRLPAAATLVAKRDDLLTFGFGGNKVRKMALVAEAARREGADTLITTGGAQSNHARVTAAVAAHLGMRCVLVLNGAPADTLTGNARLSSILGAQTFFVGSREERAPAMEAVADDLRSRGRHPVIVPLGASTPLGALGMALGLLELAAVQPPPDLIVCSSSSGGTQAGLIAGCRLAGWTTRIVGVSADESAERLTDIVRALLEGIAGLLALEPDVFAGAGIEVDTAEIGDGYGIPTARSTDATALVAAAEGMFLDPTYTAKAMAAFLDRARASKAGERLLFWHTGGLPGLLA
ncbi:MAG: pyridoxal-phosphate dependent enzyme [Vicinamibacteraceae bacterium]|nr:pyridoxal-phosphate dependent enzyme [Vicinamibacteraceae bacterium]